MPNAPQIPDQQTMLETIPEAWPGAFGLYKYSKAVIMDNIRPIVALFALSLAVGLIPSFMDDSSPTYYIVYAAANIMTVWFEAATIVIILRAVKRQTITVNDSLQQGGAMFGKFFLQSLLIGLIAVGSLLLFIVPAFFILPRLALAQYYLFDKNMGIVEAIKASWEATRGHVGKVWGIIGANVAMALLFITIIGIPFAIYFLFMYGAAYAVLYNWLVKHTTETPAPNSTLTGPVAPVK